jgi:hypothetical protein
MTAAPAAHRISKANRDDRQQVRLPRGEYLLTAHMHVVVVAAQTNWKKIAAEKKQAANKFSKVVEDDTYDGPLDMTIISPQGVNGNGPWHIIFVANQTKADSFQVMLKFLKDYKGSKTNGWNFTYDRVLKVWYSIGTRWTTRVCPMHSSSRTSSRMGKPSQCSKTCVQYHIASSCLCSHVTIARHLHRSQTCFAPSRTESQRTAPKWT